MKKTFAMLVAALTLGMAYVAPAARINVFEQNLGALPNAKWTTDVNDRANALLNDNNIDFGYFLGCKSTGYFNFSSEDYTAIIKQVGGSVQGRPYLTYRTDRYEVVPLTDTEDCDTATGGTGGACCFIAYLLRDKASLREYLCVHAGGNQFSLASDSKINAYLKPLKTLVDRCQTAHPDARLVLFHPGSANYAKTYADLLSYCDGASYMGLDLLVSETTAGGLHSGTNETHSVVSHAVLAQKVYEGSDADYPLVATIAYPHEVTFTDDETVLKQETVLDGESATAPGAPTKPGYEFAGWNPADFSQITNDTTIVATYQAAAGSVIVTFKDEDEETVLGSESVKTGETVTKPAEDPTKTGHSFKSWLKDGEPYDFATPVAAAFDLVASYTANVYTVTFRYADGTAIDTQHVEYLDDAVAPANPEPPKPTQIFLKWDRDFTAIAEDTVVTAMFIEKHSNVGTAAELLEYVAVGLPTDATLVLTNDLDFTGLTYTPSAFAATLDGNGRTVTGLSKTPIFDSVKGTVKDLTIKNCNWTEGSMANFLASRLHGATVSGCVLTNCTVSGSVYNAGIGGFAQIATTNETGVGTLITNCVVRDCTFVYSPRSGCFVGGFVRDTKVGTVFADCSFLTANRDDVALGGSAVGAGAIVGQVDGATTFIRCSNEGRVCITTQGDTGGAGGIVGRVNDGKWATLVACTNRGDVANTSSGSAGGIVGRGLKGYVSVDGCANYGAISITGGAGGQNPFGIGAGGLIGGAWGVIRKVFLSNSVNWGPITAEGGRAAGGLIGDLDSTGGGNDYVLKMTNCVNHGEVGGCLAAGGIVGQHIGVFVDGLSVVNCGNTGRVSCPTGSVGGVLGIMRITTRNNDSAYRVSGMANVMNAGAVSTESGVAGRFVGSLFGSERNAVAVCPTNLLLTTTGEATSTVGAIVSYGAKTTFDETGVRAMEAAAFTGGQAKRALNAWVGVQETAYPPWVQTKQWPDLSLFSKTITGLSVIIR